MGPRPPPRPPSSPWLLSGRALSATKSFSARRRRPVHFTRTDLRRGAESQPSLSPDGRSFVRVSSADGTQSDIYLNEWEGRTTETPTDS